MAHHTPFVRHVSARGNTCYGVAPLGFGRISSWLAAGFEAARLRVGGGIGVRAWEFKSRLRGVIELGLPLFVSLAALCQAESTEAVPTPAPVQFEQNIRPLLSSYCVKCHGPERPKGGVNLDQFNSQASVEHAPEVWQKVLSQLRDRVMPPAGKPQPSVEERERLTGWIDKMLDDMDTGQAGGDPGRVLIHRLSRVEYNNSVRDLLGVDTHPADKFPADGAGGGGFDNNADTLFIPPILMEKYLEAADEVVAQVPTEKLLVARIGPFLSERGAAHRTIQYQAERAFRRPVSKAEVQPLLALCDGAIKKGASVRDGVRLALKAILVSPTFLFRVERDQPASGPYRLDDFELAARMSYFLWASMPDEELMEAARRGRLRDPARLGEEVRRMLQDPKAGAFAESFVSQWLGTRTLKTTTQPDPGRFPQFTASLREAMYQEPIAFFLDLLRHEGSLLRLVESDYTFANGELAKHYGIQDVEGVEMRRVKFQDANRGGVLGMGAVLTLTSYPLRTSPVLRGKWVLEEVLGTPPPPPPPLVPGLPSDDAPKEGLTFRQQLEQHRSKPECAACHQRMDPLGFGLENFDAIGHWRAEIGGKPVDASGELGAGKHFAGPVELRSILLERKADFVRNLTQRMLAYALGRGLEFHDRPAVKKIIAEVVKDDYRLSSLVMSIVQSYPFEYRRNQPLIAGQP